MFIYCKFKNFRAFFFVKTLHMRSFMKINPSEASKSLFWVLIYVNHALVANI